MLKRIKETIKFSADACLTPIFWSFLVWKKWALGFGFELTDIKNGIIGIASYWGFSIDKRLHFFFLSILIISFLIVVFYWLLQSIKKRVSNSLRYLNVISLIGLAQLGFMLFNPSETHTIRFIFILMLCIIVYGGFEFFKKDIYHRENSFLLLVFAIVLSVQVPLFDLFHVYNPNHFPLLFLLFILCGWLVKNKFNIEYTRLLFAAIPILLIPALHFFGNEIYLALNQNSVYIHPKLFYGIALIILLFWSFLRMFRKKKINTSRLVSNYLLPILLANISLLAFYKPTIGQSSDLFELANPANAVLRFFRFGEWPFLDFMNSHLISDFLTSFLYVFVNGYSGSTDFLIYGFLITISLLLIKYFFLRKVLQSGYSAFLILVFLPIAGTLIPNSFTLALVTLYLIHKLFLTQSLKVFLWVLGWNIFLIFWKLDAAVANIIVSAVFITSLFVICKERKTVLLNFFKASAIYLVLLTILFFIYYLIKGNNMLVNIRQALAYFSANQAHGLPVLTYKIDRLYYVHYFIVPALLIVSFLYLAGRFADFKRKNFFLYVSVLFLIVYSLANAQRGLIRHSMAEGSEMFMVGFLYLIVPLLLILHLQNHKWRFAWFVFSSCLLVIALKYPSPNGMKSLYSESQDGISKFPEIPCQRAKIERVTGVHEFAKENYMGLKTLMDSSFVRDATFLDFSNSPMLYFYLERKVPSYFNQSLQNISTEYLQEENIKLLKKLNIPLVIFSNCPETWFDAVDDVPNSLRHYLIADYIFTNYHPFTILDKHQVWCRKGVNVRNAENFIPIDTSLLIASRTENMKKLPYLLGKSWLKRPFEILYTSNASVISPIEIHNRHNNFIEVEIVNSAANNTVGHLQYFQNGIVRGSFFFDVLPGRQLYLLPLSIHYNWLYSECNKLIVEIENKSQSYVNFFKIIKMQFNP